MKPSLIDILEYARLAPSVHNAQPWRFVINNSTISLFVASERILDAGDPTRRQLWICLGICLETLLQAGKGLGFDGKITFLQTDTIDSEIGQVTFTPSPHKHPEILKLIKNRHSYRNHLQPTTIPSSFIETCRQAIKDIPDVTLELVSDKRHINRIATMADKGMRMALSSPEFRRELAPLLNYNQSRTRIGLHGFVLNKGILGAVWEKWSVMLGLDSRRKGRDERQKVMEASGLLFVLSKGDVPSFWCNVGRAYMRVALEITRAGYVHSTITAPVEAARIHEDIERMLNTTGRVQSMIRIGNATAPLTRISPRLTVEELLT